MLKIYQEYKHMSKARQAWFKKAILRRLRDYIALIIIILSMCIEIQ